MTRQQQLTRQVPEAGVGPTCRKSRLHGNYHSITLLPLHHIISLPLDHITSLPLHNTSSRPLHNTTSLTLYHTTSLPLHHAISQLLHHTTSRKALHNTTSLYHSIALLTVYTTSVPLSTMHSHCISIALHIIISTVFIPIV